MDTTVSGALSSHNSHWLELSVDGTAQAPRERVLSVPFAQVSGSTKTSLVKRNYPCSAGWFLSVDTDRFMTLAEVLPIELKYSQWEARFFPDFSANVKSIKSMNVTLRSGEFNGITLYLYAINSYTNERITVESVSVSSDPDRAEQDFSIADIALDTERFSYYFRAVSNHTSATRPAQLVRVNLELMVEE
jgi:hypothetical protein